MPVLARVHWDSRLKHSFEWKESMRLKVDMISRAKQRRGGTELKPTSVIIKTGAVCKKLFPLSGCTGSSRPVQWWGNVGSTWGMMFEAFPEGREEGKSRRQAKVSHRWNEKWQIFSNRGEMTMLKAGGKEPVCKRGKLEGVWRKVGFLDALDDAKETLGRMTSWQLCWDVNEKIQMLEMALRDVESLRSLLRNKSREWK